MVRFSGNTRMVPMTIGEESSDDEDWGGDDEWGDDDEWGKDNGTEDN